MKPTDSKNHSEVFEQPGASEGQPSFCFVPTFKKLLMMNILLRPNQIHSNYIHEEPEFLEKGLQL